MTPVCSPHTTLAPKVWRSMAQDSLPARNNMTPQPNQAIRAYTGAMLALLDPNAKSPARSSMAVH